MTEALQSLLAAATGRPCGRGRLPLVAGQPASLPYTVLYPQGGLLDGAPLADRSEDGQFLYQVTVVAARTDQAEWLADRVRQALLGRTASGDWENLILVPGVDVWARELLVDDGVDPAGADDGMVTAVQRYKLSATAYRASSVPQGTGSDPMGAC
ncbi:hypothetical protein [Streptomyces alanosinicus]|uniref:hypothetical protein n=1 Tax=Streptomyces alanosinicus TaxID=68171 RepID=UPI001675FF1A|nr:hypothetical protein [Streptomyces alanosinicus]